MITTPVRLARAGVVLSTLLATGLVVALLLAAQPADPASALLAAATAAIALALAAGRVVLVPGRRTVTVGHRAREHAEPLSESPDASHPDADGHTRSRAPGRAVPTV